MRRPILLPAAFALALAVAACTQGGGTGGTLEGVTWQLKAYSNGSSVVDIPPGVASDAVFASGTVSGVLVCNSYAADYTASGSALTFGPVASTMMACPDTSPGVESAIVADLGKAATYTATKTTLTIFDKGGAKVLEYGAAPADPLSGTTWNVTGYNNGKQAVVSPAVGTTLTLAFGTDGSASGSGGCNSFSGTYATDGDAITFGPLASTMMACDQAVMDQEVAYFAAIGASKSFKVSGGKLEMRDPGGALQVTAAKP